MSKAKTITFSIIILTLCYLLYTRDEVVQRGKTPYLVKGTVEAGPGRNIKILLEDAYFEIPHWCYEINQGPQIVVQTTRLGGCCSPDEKPRFKLFKSADGALVGLVSERRPNVLLVLHDFDSGETWPRGEWPSGKFDDSFGVTFNRGKKLRDKLLKDNPEAMLKLSDEIP